MPIRADLHLHTHYSDGRLTPAEICAEAKNNKVELISVTDHDCMTAYPELFKCCERFGIKAVKGIEVSAYLKDVKIHTLGYNVNYESAEFKQFAKELRDGSIKRAEDILDKLNKNGVRITMEEVLKKRVSENSPVHAMYIAWVGADKGYADNPFTFYKNYLASDKCGYSGLFRPTPEQAIEAINASGGFASLAHPGRIELEKCELSSLVARLKDCGLCGIEGVYSTHTISETAYYKEMAKAFSLVVTGGSDTHVKGGKKCVGTPVFYPDEALAEKLGI